MLRTLKHIAIVALCLLVVGGAVSTQVYIFVCSQHHHGTQLSLRGEHHTCCAHDHDSDEDCQHHDGIENACCKITSQTLGVSSFEVSKITRVSKVAVVAATFDVPHICNGCCHVVRLANSSCVHSSHSPDIYSFGQLRL